MFRNKNLNLPYLSAGFPSPANDFTEIAISLDEYLIRNPIATFMAYANGDSMVDANIYNGDIIIVDRSLNAKNGDIVVAMLNGEFLIKKLVLIKNKLCLIPRNSKYPVFEISKEASFDIWGVVTYSIHKQR